MIRHSRLLLGLVLCVGMAFGVARAAPLALPKAPYFGGPSYWAKFPAMKVAHWDDPKFFPVGPWLEFTDEQAQIDLDKAVGFNTYFALIDGSNLALIRQAGMFVFLSHPLPNMGSETVGWVLRDEPDLGEGAGHGDWNGKDPPNDCMPTQDQGGKCGFTVLAQRNKQVDAYDPGHTRPRFANVGKSALFWLGQNDASEFINRYTDIISADDYPYTDLDDCLSTQLGRLVSGAGPIDGGGGHSVTEAQCHRASNYGLTVRRIAQIDAADGKLQPVFTWIEEGHPSSNNEWPTITAQQMQGAVMDSLINGAAMIG